MTRTEPARQRSGQQQTRPVRPPSDIVADLAENLTPRQIVEHLDRYIVGQDDAKRAVAVALCNRWRRQQGPEESRAEIRPANILMIGPTRVGKTEIARRVAQPVDAPFVKVEATHFTEVGYVGKDVESIVRDLVELAVSKHYRERIEGVREEAVARARQRLIDLLTDQALGEQRDRVNSVNGDMDAAAVRKAEQAARRRWQREWKRWERLLDRREAEETEVVLDVDEPTERSLPYADGDLGEEMQPAIADMLDDMFAPPRARRRLPVREARRMLETEESARLVDDDAVVDEAIQAVETAGVVFLDELDKTITTDDAAGVDISAGGVQRDLLPVLEGTMVQTRYGPVRTDHVLFIASGAFLGVRPSDLIPELQGRFPVRVELQSLREDDLYAILTTPEFALPWQYATLLEAEGVVLEIEDDAMRRVAQLAAEINARQDDIGARRLQTLLERVLEEALFAAPDTDDRKVRITVDVVNGRVGEAAGDEDLSLYIL